MKYKKHLAEIADENFTKLFDQLFASIWHKNANREEPFGNKHWDFHAFSIYQEIGENLFTCIDSDGKLFVLYSGSAKIHYDAESFTCCSILVDMGGWFLCYGPVFSWKEIFPEDLLYLASRTASQLYEQQGFSAVVQFNPIPIWASVGISEMPPLLHKNKEIINCFQECRFKDDIIPDLPKSFHLEKKGNLSRWITNAQDYLSSYGLYYDEKSKVVFVYAHNKEDFYIIQKQLSKYIIPKKDPEFVSMAMLSFSMELFKKNPLIIDFEQKFEN